MTSRRKFFRAFLAGVAGLAVMPRDVLGMLGRAFARDPSDFTTIFHMSDVAAVPWADGECHNVGVYHTNGRTRIWVDDVLVRDVTAPLT